MSLVGLLLLFETGFVDSDLVVVQSALLDCILAILIWSGSPEAIKRH